MMLHSRKVGIIDRTRDHYIGLAYFTSTKYLFFIDINTISNN